MLYVIHLVTQNVRYHINTVLTSVILSYRNIVILPKSYSKNKQSSSNTTNASLKARLIFQELLE